MGKKWGDEKNAHFFKNQKNGELKKKKKMGGKWGGEKNRPFSKNGHAKKKKMGERWAT